MSNETIRGVKPGSTVQRHVPIEIQRVASEICAEYMSAAEMYPRFCSPHEGLSVITEEFEELKREVFKSPRRRNLGAMRSEAIQLGAMALRFVYELLSDEEGRAYVEPTDNDPDGDHACEDLKQRVVAETGEDEVRELANAIRNSSVTISDLSRASRISRQAIMDIRDGFTENPGILTVRAIQDALGPIAPDRLEPICAARILPADYNAFGGD
jgi:hypothetical protein